MSTSRSRPTGILTAADNIVRRFLKRLVKYSYSAGECIQWSGGHRGDPKFQYPVTNINGQYCSVSRVVYEYNTKQPLLPGQIVRHACDNPKCINPLHLVVGTLSDNAKDMVERGRMFHPDISGSKHHNTKLTEQDVINLRNMRKEGFKLKELADKFNLSVSQICAICKGRDWKHLSI